MGALLYYVLVDKRRGADVQPTRRLCCNEESQRPRAFTRHDHFLLVPARETPSPGQGVRSTYIKGLHQTRGMGSDGHSMSHHAARKRPVIIRIEHKVVGDGIALNHAVFITVFRNVCYTAFGELSWGRL